MTVNTFIERPVLSIVISVAIVILGGIALASLPIEQFPDIAPPTVEVMTSYPGANGNSSLGTGVVGGLLVGAVAMLFFVPAFFVVFQAMQERIKS